jgi:hypothetical protein
MRYRIELHKGSGAVRVQEECWPGYWRVVREGTKDGMPSGWTLFFPTVEAAQRWCAGQLASGAIQREDLWEAVEELGTKEGGA